MRDAYSDRTLSAIERTTKEVGRALFSRLDTQRPSILERRWWDDHIMSWAMQDESVKLQMFRFVDVLPMLRDSVSVTRHLHEYFDEIHGYLPSAVRLGLAAARPRSIAGRALAIAARRNVLGYARRFIAGTDADGVLAAAMRQRKLRLAFTIDVLGEAVTSEAEADRYVQAYLDLLDAVAPAANRWHEIPQIDRHGLELLPRTNVSIKLSGLTSRFDAVDPPGTAERVGHRLRTLLRRARHHRAFVNVDMESYGAKDLTLYIFKEVLAEEEFHATSNVGIVIQCYLKDAEADLVALYDWARERGTPVWVRLVKGAYWDFETTHARATEWPVPVFEEKHETDANFERLTRLLLANHEVLRPAIASHNIRSLAHAIATARHLGLSSTAFELQMLYGMGDPVKQVLVEAGHRVRTYMPCGELIPGMAYLVRRLLENTSNDSFLRASFSENVSPEKLLMNPHDAKASVAVSAQGASTEAPPRINFRNEPPADFAIASNRDGLAAAIDDVRSHFGLHYPLWIDGEPVETREQHASVNPSHKWQTVGTCAVGDRYLAAAAVAAARHALHEWWALGASRRARYLRDAAAAIRARRFELAAWEVHECGKGWREADADVCEAIDFCEYYATGAVALEQGGAWDVPGEENCFDYLPRGVTAVIAPWNFPLAILTGMTTAALATGNTVVMKPAEQAPIVAAKLMEIFAQIALPKGVVNYLPGPGETVGAALVEHVHTAVIAFTGSREVGLAINRRAAEVSAASGEVVKRVVAEMGGKNAIIVDDDADLDEAVLGVLRSTFGYQGQKCSACSRCIVLDAVHDPFVERLVEAARSLTVGPAEDPGTDVGPVIDAASLEKIDRYIEIGRGEAREILAVDAGPLADEGYYVGPHIFADVPPTARIAQEEIFGPVLAVIRVDDFDQAIRVVNGSEYALTAGVFSRSPAHLRQARSEIMVGNLYLNRSITGALVGRQPFGGFKMSGMGSKAGGPDYLYQFVMPRTVTENSLRRGFAPALVHHGDTEARK